MKAWKKLYFSFKCLFQLHKEGANFAQHQVDLQKVQERFVGILTTGLHLTEPAVYPIPILQPF